MARRSSEKDLDRGTQQRLQLLLTRMLREDDNKYCVDCDAKGPRWASWNLGVFVCIRCAGIHRNLGVHISKVRSVNLDSWTPQQVASMQLMGNSRGRLVYEATLPSDFIRPQSDQSMEQFIRDKYERKKYIDKQFRPETPPMFPQGWEALLEAEKQKRDLKRVVLPSHIVPAVAKTSNNEVGNKENKTLNKEESPKSPPVSQPKTPSSTTSVTNVQQDLLGLSLDSSSSTDVFGDLVSVDASDNDNSSFSSVFNSSTNNVGSNSTESKLNGNNVSSNANDLLGLHQPGVGFDAPKSNNGFSPGLEAPPVKPQTSSSFSDLESLNDSTPTNSNNKMSKDSIMALFGKTPIINNNISMGAQPNQQFGVNTGGNGGLFMGMNPQSNPFLNASSFPQPQSFNSSAQKPVMGNSNDLLGLFN